MHARQGRTCQVMYWELQTHPPPRRTQNQILQQTRMQTTQRSLLDLTGRPRRLQDLHSAATSLGQISQVPSFGWEGPGQAQKNSNELGPAHSPRTRQARSRQQDLAPSFNTNGLQENRTKTHVKQSSSKLAALPLGRLSRRALHDLTGFGRPKYIH